MKMNRAHGANCAGNENNSFPANRRTFKANGIPQSP